MGKAGQISLRHRIENIAIRALVGALMALPYERRIGAAGWAISRIVAPVIGWRRRALDQLAYAMPELPAAERRRLATQVCDNAGRSIIESLSVEEFKARVGPTPLQGPGLPALEAARAAGRPVVLISGHFGNYDAGRAAIADKFGPVAALYKPMRNPAFNAYYSERMNAMSPPAFPTGRAGLVGLTRLLRSGNMIALLNDLHFGGGKLLTFFGHPAPTALTAAEWALKFDAPLIPFFGIRQPDGLSFEVRIDTPIPPTDAETMTQGYNDLIERMARAHPEQWFWIHRRWKPERQRTRAAAKTGPSSED